MVHLTVDIGNTATKAAIHVVAAEDAVVEAKNLRTTAPLLHRRVEGHDLAWLSDFVAGHAVDACIVSSTADITPDIWQHISSLGIPHVVRFDHTTPIPLTNCYSTPRTLGSDRLAAAIGAWYENRERTGRHTPVLIIDVGTAITYDLVTADGQYLGGNISPGIQLRFFALHEHTAHLPLVEIREAGPEEIGISTSTAILHGVIDGVRHEIEGFIREFSLKNPLLSVFLTGGDTINFSESTKNRIFADKFLVSKGLDLVLQHNNQ